MGLSKQRQEEVVKDIASNIVVGCRKGGHTCVNCGQIHIPLWGMAEEFKPKVKGLVEKELRLSVGVGSVIDGYCPECRWEKFGSELIFKVRIDMVREGRESQGEIIERLKARLTSLGAPFTIQSIDPKHWVKGRW